MPDTFFCKITVDYKAKENMAHPQCKNLKNSWVK